MNLPLSPELDARLQAEAARRGVPAEAVVLRLLDERLPPLDTPERRQVAIETLDRWIEEDGGNGTAEEIAEFETMQLRLQSGRNLADVLSTLSRERTA